MASARNAQAAVSAAETWSARPGPAASKTVTRTPAMRPSRLEIGALKIRRGRSPAPVKRIWVRPDASRRRSAAIALQLTRSSGTPPLLATTLPRLSRVRKPATSG